MIYAVMLEYRYGAGRNYTMVERFGSREREIVDESVFVNRSRKLCT